VADSSVLIGILVVALAVYAMRLAGYLLGSRLRRDSIVSRVLDALPGAALAGVLALSVLERAAAWDLLALAATAGMFLWTGRTLPALSLGLAIAVANAHLA
jgi:uncharacterized membrane protein